MAITVERYFVVPHTHWDREWYRPFEHFPLLLGSVVDEVLDTLERDPAVARLGGPVSMRRTRLDESSASAVQEREAELGPGAIASFRLNR